MSERDHDDIRRLLQNAFPPVNAELRRDLWARRFVWYDWALAGLAGTVIAAFPDLIFVLLYHL